MGHPRRSRKRYETPNHPWQTSRIVREKEITKKYGLRSNREIWKAESRLRKYRREARHLLAEMSASAGDVSDYTKTEVESILSSLKRKGVLKEEGDLDDILALSADDFLKRRLQTIVHQKGLASSMDQARQLVVHGHIAINGCKKTVPSYMVPVDEEGVITYYQMSPLNNELHPVRPGKIAAAVPVEEADNDE